MRKTLLLGGIILSFATQFLSFATRAKADLSFAIVRDDGSYSGFRETTAGINRLERHVFEEYQAQGNAIPQVMSIWSLHNRGGSGEGTLFAPHSQEIRGIGLGAANSPYAQAPNGVFESDNPPLQAVLLHNSFRSLARAAERAGSTDASAYGEYLFLLEFGHLIGSNLQIQGAEPALLMGTDASWKFHWSFFMDAGGSPLGGNLFRDLGQGRFEVTRANPSTLNYSMLDLYMFGLARADEVPNFYVLTNTQLETASLDPSRGGPVSSRTFPWMSNDSVLVRGEKRTVTMDEVVAQNGARLPSVNDAQKEWTLGIVLVVPEDIDESELATGKAEFQVFAGRLAPAFSRATRGRASLEIVSRTESAESDAGVADGSVDSSAVPLAKASGCSVSASTRLASSFAGASNLLGLVGLLGLVVLQRKRRSALKVLDAPPSSR